MLNNKNNTNKTPAKTKQTNDEKTTQWSTFSNKNNDEINL
jgi:hypothetical protein